MPFSNVTFTSFLFTCGSSAVIKYSLSSSVMSTSGAHSAAVIFSSPSPRRNGRPNNEAKRLCISSNSRNGSHRLVPLDGSQRVRPCIVGNSFPLLAVRFFFHMDAVHRHRTCHELP